MLRAGSRLSNAARSLSASRLARTKTDFTVSLLEPIPGAECGLEAPEAQRQLVEFTNGIYVGATTSSSPLTTVNIVVRAGSRYELPEEAGVSHFMRRVAYKSTDKHSAVYMTCLPQWYGMQLSCTGTRDAIVYSGTCVKDDVDHLLDVMCQSVLYPKFYNWEVRYFPCEPDHLSPRLLDADSRVAGDRAGLAMDKNASLFDAVQNRAFRGGLSNSVFCPAHCASKITENEVAAYHKRRYVGSNIGVFASGIHPEDLVTGVTRHGLYNVAKGEATSLKAEGVSKFTGATYEVRHESDDANVTAVLVGQGAGLSAEKAHISSLLLNRVLGAGENMQSGTRASRINVAVAKAVGSRPSCARSVNVNYSDNGLFGVQVEAGRDDIRTALKAAVGEFALASANVSEKEVKAAKDQLRADLQANQETAAGVLEDMAFQTLYRGGKYLVPDKVAERIDSVTLKDVKAFGQSVVNGKHVLGLSGDLTNAPYVDELGL